MRKFGRVDANQRKVVKELRDLGFSVAILSSVGSGVPDLLLGIRGQNFLVELKDGSKPLSQRKLTPAEKEFHINWRGCSIVAGSTLEILEGIGFVSKKT